MISEFGEFKTDASRISRSVKDVTAMLNIQFGSIQLELIRGFRGFRGFTRIETGDSANNKKFLLLDTVHNPIIAKSEIIT